MAELCQISSFWRIHQGKTKCIGLVLLHNPTGLGFIGKGSFIAKKGIQDKFIFIEPIDLAKTKQPKKKCLKCYWERKREVRSGGEKEHETKRISAEKDLGSC